MSQSKPFNRQKIMNTRVTRLSLIVGGGECLLCSQHPAITNTQTQHSFQTLHHSMYDGCIATKRVW